MILFGSNLAKHFVLDTVFIIKDWDEYAISEIKNLGNKYNQTFYDVSLAPMVNSGVVPCKETISYDSVYCLPTCGDDEKDNKPTKITGKFRVYKAVMHNDKHKFNDIFSYAPCLPDPDGKKGFARPIIDLPYISQSLNQGIRIIRKQDVVKAWNEITTTVLNQEIGLNLMIKNDLPKICTTAKKL